MKRRFLSAEYTVIERRTQLENLDVVKDFLDEIYHDFLQAFERWSPGIQLQAFVNEETEQVLKR